MVKGFDEHQMREERYRAILAAYGADSKKWPEAERAAAIAFGAAHPDASRRDEAALDALLGAYASAQPADDEAALARILAGMNAASPNAARLGSGRIAPLRPARRTASSSWFADRRMMAAGFVFAALAGLAIGFNGAGVGLSTADASDELVVSYALADG